MPVLMIALTIVISLRDEDQQTENRSLRYVWMPRMQGAFERLEPVIEDGHVNRPEFVGDHQLK